MCLRQSQSCENRPNQALHRAVSLDGISIAFCLLSVNPPSSSLSPRHLRLPPHPHFIFTRVCLQRLDHGQHRALPVLVPGRVLEARVKVLAGAVGQQPGHVGKEVGRCVVQHGVVGAQGQCRQILLAQRRIARNPQAKKVDL